MFFVGRFVAFRRLSQQMVFASNNAGDPNMHCHRSLVTLTLRCHRNRKWNSIPTQQHGRYFSSSCPPNSHVIADASRDDGIVVVSLNRPPANTLTLECMSTLRDTIIALEADESVRALVLTASNPTIFSAGLALEELLNPEVDRLGHFWDSFQGLSAALFATPLATACAMEGHAPGGGCVLALTCENRVMSTGRIGLNELALGLVWMHMQRPRCCRTGASYRGISSAPMRPRCFSSRVLLKSYAAVLPCTVVSNMVSTTKVWDVHSTSTRA
eukprot:m.1098042 g.1098042  ORF g.1098042 m.1098042 type:complete len:271 (+) comp24311_c0_seq33:202-1014(+)